MTNIEIILLILSVIEIILLILVLLFFFRLKKSEKFVANLQKKQEDFIQKLSFSYEMEKEFLNTFTTRQEELIELEKILSKKTKELKKLILKAEQFTNSPLFVKQIILMGHKAGESIESLAKTFNLTQEEVELILEHSK